METIPLLGPTKARVLRELREADRNAVEMAALLRLQVSAVRKHLERLRSLGFVDVRFEARGPGRPKKLFLLTDAGRELFARRYDTVLNALVSAIAKDRGGAYVESMMNRVAADVAASIVETPGTDAAHRKRIQTGLRDLGFEPSLKTEDGVCVITSRNCPVLQAARAHGELVCRGLHAEVLRLATGASRVERGAWIVDGDPVCVHRVPKTRAPPSG